MSKENLFLLSIDEHGKVELLEDGETIWSSDGDPDVLEEFRRDTFLCDSAREYERLTDALVTYLVREGVITDREIDTDGLDIETPGDDGDGDEDEEEEEEDDAFQFPWAS